MDCCRPHLDEITGVIAVLRCRSPAKLCPSRWWTTYSEQLAYYGSGRDSLLPTWRELYEPMPVAA